MKCCVDSGADLHKKAAMTHMDNTTDQQEVDIELEAARQAYERAQRRKADAQDAERRAIQAAIAKREADEQERLLNLRREHEAQVERVMAKRKAEADAKAAAERVRLEENRRLEMELQARDEAQRKENERLEVIRKISEAARQAEIDAENIEATLRAARTPKFEEKPSTLSATPLSVIFNPNAEELPPVPIQEITAEQNAALQKEKDAQAEVKARITHQRSFPSHQQIYALQNAFLKHTGYNVNFDQLSEVLAFFPDNTVMAKMLDMVPLWKARPVSAAQMVAQLQTALENPEQTVQEQPAPLSEAGQLKAYITKLTLQPEAGSEAANGKAESAK